MKTDDKQEYYDRRCVAQRKLDNHAFIGLMLAALVVAVAMGGYSLAGSVNVFAINSPITIEQK